LSIQASVEKELWQRIVLPLRLIRELETFEINAMMNHS